MYVICMYCRWLGWVLKHRLAGMVALDLCLRLERSVCLSVPSSMGESTKAATHSSMCSTCISPIPCTDATAHKTVESNRVLCVFVTAMDRIKNRNKKSSSSSNSAYVCTSLCASVAGRLCQVGGWDTKQVQCRWLAGWLAGQNTQGRSKCRTKSNKRTSLTPSIVKTVQVCMRSGICAFVRVCMWGAREEANAGFDTFDKREITGREGAGREDQDECKGDALPS
ncbi:hypothetical protein IWX49DRAFT_53575 [Phyllosticta citricarpa]